MWFWWYMLVCSLLVPVIMVIAGWLMWKHGPKKINAVYGYRTARSMQNMETWKFAHEYCGKIWWILGWATLAPSALVLIPFYHSNEDVIGIVGTALCVVQLILLIAFAATTENALKKHFNEDGTRKENGQ